MSGGATQDVRAVSQADMDRARVLLTAQLLDEAYQGLQSDAYLVETEFIPRQSLVVQASEVAYSRFLHERADSLGVHMRILVTGLAVDRDNAEAVAYAALTRHLSPGYDLVAANFEIGEEAEEPVGNGDITFFVTASGYSVANIDQGAAKELVLGKPLAEAHEILSSEMPLAEPPRIQVWPDWLERVPVLPLRITVQTHIGLP